MSPLLAPQSYQPTAPPPSVKMGRRETSWKSNSCLSLQRGPPRRDLLSMFGTGNYNTWAICSPLVCLSYLHLILLLFAVVLVRYRSLSKHPRENHLNCLGRGDRHRQESQDSHCQQGLAGKFWLHWLNHGALLGCTE